MIAQKCGGNIEYYNMLNTTTDTTNSSFVFDSNKGIQCMDVSFLYGLYIIESDQDGTMMFKWGLKDDVMCDCSYIHQMMHHIMIKCP